MGKDADIGASRYKLVVDKGSAHWYEVDGAPRHDCNIRSAKRYGYLPSVTSVLKMWPKPALDRWKIEQAILAAITLPRLKDESDDAFAKRVAQDMGEEAKSAAAVGTDLHRMMAVRLTTGEWPKDTPKELLPWAEAYEPWIKREILHTHCSETVLVNPHYGYAGTVDLIADTQTYGHAVLDFKNQNVRGQGPAFYDEWLMQLAAYSMAWKMRASVKTLVSIVLNRNQPDPPALCIWPQTAWGGAWAKFKSCLKLWCLYKDYDPAAVTVDRHNEPDADQTQLHLEQP